MSSYQNIDELPVPDIAIVGGGIVGLWTAYYAAKAGQKVVLIEQGELGSGASNGVLGALMPHQPINWNEKKQFQLDGLTTLPDEIARLQNLTGVECGYFRCGRVMPITNAQKRQQSENWVVGAHDHWVRPFEWAVQDENPAANWMLSKGNHGYNSDTLSARVNPRALVAALTANIKQQEAIAIIPYTKVTSLLRDGSIALADKSIIKPGKTIVTAGFESFDLLAGLTGKKLGYGIKGQAALLRPLHAVDVAAPIIYDNGTYVIVHENGLVAVGSTSERDYTTPHTTDDKLDDIISSATILCPALKDAEVVERWAGVRPRATGRDPLIGVLPDSPDVIVATGGFKITLAIAHIMARSALSAAAGHTDAIPASFKIEAHL